MGSCGPSASRSRRCESDGPGLNLSQNGDIRYRFMRTFPPPPRVHGRPRWLWRSAPPQTSSTIDARRLIVAATATICLLAGWMASADAAPPSGNSVVAVVNAQPITRDQLATAAVDRYGRELLENMVNRDLILQQCKARGIQITSGDVQAEIERMATKFGLTLDGYLQLLRDERDITPSRYAREIIWPMLALRQLVADEVAVQPAEFNAAYLAQYGEAIKCRMIMVDDRGLAESLAKQAKADPSRFATLAKAHSQDETSASIGGLIPPIRRNMGDDAIEQAAFQLGDGEISSVLPIGDQWIVLQSVRRIAAHQPSPQAMPAIRQQVTDRIRDEKVKTAAAALFAKLQTEAKVVHVLGDEALSKRYPGVAAIINGQSISVGAVAKEAVRQHGAEVLEGEINRRVLTQALTKAKVAVSRADIDAEIHKAAKAYGFSNPDGTADLEGWFASVTSDGKTTRAIYETDAVWPSVALKKLVEPTIQLTEQDLERGFVAAYGPRVEVLACVLSDQRTAQKVWELARDQPTEAFFGQLAEQYSIEPMSASNNGKVPPIRQHGGQPTLEAEAFKMKPGELSGIIATGDKYILMRCQGHTEPIVTDRSVVESELRRDLYEQKLTVAMGRKFDELRNGSEVDNFFKAETAAPAVAARRVIKK